MGPSPCRTGQAKSLQHQAEGFVPGSKDCLLSPPPTGSCLQGLCTVPALEASRAPRTSWVGGAVGRHLLPPPPAQNRWSSAGQSVNTSLKMTPHAVTLLLPTVTHWETGDTRLGGKNVGSQDQIEAYLFSPKISSCVSFFICSNFLPIFCILHASN